MSQEIRIINFTRIEIDDFDRKGKIITEILSEEELLDRAYLKSLEKIDDWSKHFWDGIMSEFPFCCIFFFIDVWKPLRRSKRMFAEKEARLWLCHEGYILCPDCAVRLIESRINKGKGENENSKK